MIGPASRTGQLAASALVLLCIVGCGYRLSGGKNPLLKDVDVIAVLPFDNRTDRPEIEQRVTEETAQELAKRGSYRVGTDPAAADAVLVGAITNYLTVPVQFTGGGRATRVESTVIIEATLRNTANDEVLWSQAGLVFKEQYDIPESGEFFDQETVALDDIARGAAGRLVTSILEGY